MKKNLFISIFTLSLMLLAACSSEPVSETATEQTSTSATASDPSDVNKINLNDMQEDQLLNTIPDFSNRMVREFFEYQPYISIQEFRREIGKYVSDEKVAEYEQYIFVPIDINESDAATIAQIPGVDETLAETLISGRPYDSSTTFLDSLAETAPDIDLAIAKSFLAN